MTLSEELPPLSPVQFFSLFWDCPYSKGGRLGSEALIPDASEFCAEESFAKLSMAWNEEKVLIEVRVEDRTEGDSVELFFDTRDLKTRSHLSKFCHHFIFTPDEVEGVHGREITRFYNDDIHPLADPDDLSISIDADESSYVLKIEIPAHCLYGFEPSQFPRMGFTYRINRAKKTSQHFSVCDDEFKIEQHPSLWATFTLTGAT